MDRDRIIAEVAKRNGVLLTRDDPILLVSTMLELHAAEQSAGFTDKQVEEIGRRLARGCEVWSGGMVQAAIRKHYAIMLAALLAAAAAGGGVSWLAFGMPLHPVCAVTQAGGRLCGAWVVPEKTK